MAHDRLAQAKEKEDEKSKAETLKKNKKVISNWKKQTKSKFGNVPNWKKLHRQSLKKTIIW